MSHDMSYDMDSAEGGSALGLIGGGLRPKKVLSRKEKIQEELKLLEWHKMANDAAIKASLMQNRQLKAAIPNAIPAHTDDDAKWMKKVIQQEHIKPLEVNKDYVLEYERREKENEERLTMQVERHIGTLQKLRGKLEAKAEMKTRTDEYRQWQRTFNEKKQEVLLGKTLAEIEAVELSKENAGNKPTLMPTKRVKPPSELSNVLDSLNKLSELENRITSLEKDNVYERMVQAERPSADRRTVMDFRKSRAITGPEDEPGRGPKAVVYTMRPKQKSWQVAVPGITKTAKRNNGVPPMNDRRDMSDYDDEGGGTFALTGISENNNGASQRSNNPKLDRARRNHDATAGQRALKGRVQAKKAGMADKQNGARRHEEALGELNRRRNEQQIQKRAPRSMGASKGASAGIKTKNSHMNDFMKTKDQFKNRTDKLKRRGVGAAADPRAGRGSRTAPAMSNTTRSMPAIKGAGNMTRRITDKAPQRRSAGGLSGQNGPSSAPAVGGVRGIRGLKKDKEKM